VRQHATKGVNTMLFSRANNGRTRQETILNKQ